MNWQYVKDNFRKICPPNVDYCGLRVHREVHERVTVNRGIIEPFQTNIETGGMLTVYHKGGMGYAATTCLDKDGLAKARDKALALAEIVGRRSVFDFSSVSMTHAKGYYQSKVKKLWSDVSLKDKIDFLQKLSGRLKSKEEIVDWSVGLWAIDDERLLLTNDGGEVFQKFSFLIPDMRATAADGNEAISRSFGGRYGYTRQGGLEILDDIGFEQASTWIPEEAAELLRAPQCPTEKMDILLDPGQMMLQIHESIGHPLELDRILGDERNYAGTSFVTKEMFGNFQYGSPLLNVTVSSDFANEVSSYDFDDEGDKTTKEFIIKDGVLLRPLGGLLSRHRAGMALGVANTRADSWRRPAIDRMSNLNVEPGETSLESMIRGVKKGIFMKTNTSWSIDDARNKFQFGCEWGQLIEDGELTQVVKKPNYRGRSSEFWRNLFVVGNQETFDVMGTPYCGKGEPNQAIRVGHGSPICGFRQVDVFGGDDA
jgi:predicted Zn-dependent protease